MIQNINMKVSEVRANEYAVSEQTAATLQKMFTFSKNKL